MNRTPLTIIRMPAEWAGIDGGKNSLRVYPDIVEWLNLNVGPRAINLIDFKVGVRAGVNGWFYGHDLVNVRSRGVVGGWRSETKAHLFYFPEFQHDKALLFKLTWSGYAASI